MPAKKKTTKKVNGSDMIKVPKNSTTDTLPSLPLSQAYPRKQIGDSGTRMASGIITEEYNSQLQGIQGIRVFDEMRKSDGTVRAAVLVCVLPIMRAKWFVNQATPDPQDAEISNFVEHALFDWLDISWDDVIRQALLMVPFGVMPFEKIYGIKDFEGKTYVTLSKLAPRMPRSIQQWELPDKTFGIQQIRQDGQPAYIPGSKLLLFINEREGDNWWGTSMLRAAYKHWYFKNNFYKLDAIAFERQGIGVPLIKMPVGYTESDERKAIQAAQNLRGNQNGYMILPPEYEAEFMNMGATTVRDPEKSINHHNKEILQSVLAQFLELGSTSSSGSRALSEDHTDLFLKAMEAIANTITSEINKNLIPELVDMNFNDVKVYPVLDYSGITKVDVAAIAKAYAEVVTAGGIVPTKDDEQYLRIAMGLPPRTQDDTPTTEDQEDHMDIEKTADGADAKIDKATEEVPPEKATPKDTKTIDTATKKKAHDHEGINFRAFDDGHGFQSWRPLTFAEQKVSWKRIEEKMDAIEAGFSDEAKATLQKSKDKFMAKLKTAMDAGKPADIAALELKFVSDYKQVLKDTMRKAYEYGKTNAAIEMGVMTPANTASSMQNIDLLADTMAYKTASDIETKAKVTIANHMKQDTSTLQALGAVDAALDEIINKTVDRTAAVAIGQSINNGRFDLFERNTDKIYALQRSEILDQKTCDFCLSMDGLIVDMNDSWAKTDVFHDYCRGIWVEILKDEKNPPQITGVPDTIGDYYGGVPNDLTQPRKPIVRPDSPAADEVARRKEEKSKKA